MTRVLERMGGDRLECLRRVEVGLELRAVIVDKVFSKLMRLMQDLGEMRMMVGENQVGSDVELRFSDQYRELMKERLTELEHRALISEVGGQQDCILKEMNETREVIDSHGVIDRVREKLVGRLGVNESYLFSEACVRNVFYLSENSPRRVWREFETNLNNYQADEVLVRSICVRLAVGLDDHAAWANEVAKGYVDNALQ